MRWSSRNRVKHQVAPERQASPEARHSWVVLTGQNPKKYPQVEGLRIALTKRHGKIRRDGYRT
jgi:hypothetical protein